MIDNRRRENALFMTSGLASRGRKLFAAGRSSKVAIVISF